LEPKNGGGAERVFRGESVRFTEGVSLGRYNTNEI